MKKIYKENPPFCEHGNTSTLYLSRSKANFNRAFFKCSNGIGYDPCPYFQWADEEPNEFTLSLNHPRPGYFAQRPLLPPPPAKIAKRAKTSSNKKKETTPIEVTYLILPVKRARQFKKEPKESKGNKKIKKEIPSRSQITVLQEGNNQDPGIPCTSQEIQSIEHLFEATLD